MLRISFSSFFGRRASLRLQPPQHRVFDLSLRDSTQCEEAPRPHKAPSPKRNPNGNSWSKSETESDTGIQFDLNIIRDRPASTETTPPQKNALISTDLFLKHLQHLDAVLWEFHLGVISVIGVDELPQRIVGGKEEHGLGVVLWGDRSKCLELATLEGPFRPRQATAPKKTRNKNFQWQVFRPNSFFVKVLFWRN